MKKNNFLVVTTDEIPGKKIVKVLGLVRGNTVRCRNMGVDIGAGFKNLVGGEIKNYTAMSNQARDEALNRMVNDAISQGANAIVAVRFTTSMIMASTSEMFAFGTAVVVK
jgi:uncharacterized protein YbjQ (UPF0145 family)